MTGNPFSSENAYKSDFDSLEARIFQQEIDDDKAVVYAIRLKPWQETAFQSIQRQAGTNIVETGWAAYIHGRKILEARLGKQAIKQYNDKRQHLRLLVMNLDGSDVDMGPLMSEIQTDKLSVPEVSDENYGDPVSFKVLDSIKSEMDNRISDEMRINATHINRLMMVLGLRDSNVIPDSIVRKTDSLMENFERTYLRASRHIDNTFVRVLTRGYEVWANGGIRESDAECVDSYIELMETDHKDSAKFWREKIRDDADVVGDNYYYGSTTI